MALYPPGPQGTDNQTFCYDSENRLVWAGSSGTPSCGTPLTPGTLTSAAYTQTYSYDPLNRLSTGPGGTSTYGDSSHLDAVTSTSGGYTASYDAAGSMTCRAPSSSQVCPGSLSQSLSYDGARQLDEQTDHPAAERFVCLQRRGAARGAELQLIGGRDRLDDVLHRQL